MTSTRLETSPARRRALVVALVGVAAVWGVTFPVVKDAVAELPPFEFLAIRFAIAALAMTAVFGRSLRALPRSGLLAGLAAGVALIAGYAFQTVGLQYTTASNAGFITGLFVVFTPILSTVLLRRPPGARAAIGVATATIGLFLLAFTAGGFHVRYGDGLVLLCAVSFAAHIVILGRFAPELPAGALATVQLWVAAIVSGAATLSFEPHVAPTGGSVWMALLITAVFASAAAFFIQTLAQRYLEPTRAALILVSEPAFAGLFGYLILGETLTVRGWIGAALILAAMVWTEASAPRATDR